MTRVRNADEFLLKFRKILTDYDQLFGPRLRQIRNTYAAEPGGYLVSSTDESLEAHTRAYIVNSLLAALNWRLDARPWDGLASLIPEVPIRSRETQRVRFLDYLGLERNTDSPLLIVETKRPSAALPITLTPAATYSEVVSRGLSGESLSGEWKRWLDDLGDYVRSAYERTNKAPRRVVLTNGDWLILFLDPADAFLDGGSRDPNRILAFSCRNNIEERFGELYMYLEHQQVLGKTPALAPGELLFHLSPDGVEQVMHGLHLRYIQQPGIYRSASVIKVAPMLFLRSRYGASFWVESPLRDYELPHVGDELPRHLADVQQAAQELLSEVNGRLGRSVQVQSVARHYQDEEGFAATPGVYDCGPDEFLVATGDNTHYLLPEPSVLDCPFHDWLSCNGAGVAGNPEPIAARSTSPRSFFVSAELHHCAHLDVSSAKASPVTTANRDRCGARSGQEGHAFCEIWRFEQHLCCRTCAFEEVCTSAAVFRLPCVRPDR